MTRVSPHMTANARALRNGATEAERKLWRLLCRYRPKFTRQLVIGPYIADFACRAVKLIVELDGSQHLAAAVRDDRRSADLAQDGWTVMRFWNGQVLGNPEGVVTMIVDEVAALTGGTHPQPLPFREGRERVLRSRRRASA